MSDILDIIPFSSLSNKDKINNDEINDVINNQINNEKIQEEYDDIIDNTSYNDNSNKNKNRITKLLVIILCYLNYVNYKKTNNNKILIKSKL